MARQRSRRPASASDGAEVLTRLGWQAQAACRGLDTDAFFDPEDDAPAKRICGVCPVREACLGFAVAAGERFGVWGGLNEKERARLTTGEREQIIERAVQAA